jgi:Eukaryotic-type carbonic anhydrase
LDLYIRRWKKEEKRVHDECHRKLSSALTPKNIRRTLIESLGVNDNVQQFRRPFTPYDWLKRVETEYYFRYEGSQTVPPCFSQSVHWRVMKNSIRVSPVQIQQLEDLIANRLNPISCIIDTAGKSRSSNNKKVDVNRPIQSISPAHKLVFCECINWVSNISKDVAWCNSTTMQRGVLPFVNNKTKK